MTPCSKKLLSLETKNTTPGQPASQRHSTSPQELRMALLGSVSKVPQISGTTAAGPTNAPRPSSPSQSKEAVQKSLLAGKPPSRGPRNAPTTVVVFSDFQCPYCAQAAAALRRLVPSMGGDVRVVIRHFPLFYHGWALTAAKAASCVNAQSPDAFGKLHDYYFEHQSAFTRENVVQRSLEVVQTLPRVNVSAYKKCVASASTDAIVGRDVELGKMAGVGGTPTFFVNGERISGVPGLAQAIQQVKGELSLPTPSF